VLARRGWTCCPFQGRAYNPFNRSGKSEVSTFWPLGRVMVSGPASFLLAALLLLLLFLRAAVARPEPAMPFADGDLLFFPIALGVASAVSEHGALCLRRCKQR